MAIKAIALVDGILRLFVWIRKEDYGIATRWLFSRFLGKLGMTSKIKTWIPETEWALPSGRKDNADQTTKLSLFYLHQEVLLV